MSESRKFEYKNYFEIDEESGHFSFLPVSGSL